MRPTTLKLLAATILMAGFGWTQDSDEPGRGVARISLINGDVSVRRGDSGDWVAAAVNAPLVVEDAVFTGANSRAEVQFDWANMVRLAENSEVRLAQLENNRYIIQVARGTITFLVLRDSQADVEISTPSVSVRPRERGAYRITVGLNGESEITVRSGEAEIFTPKGVERLRAGRTMLARGSASDPEFQIVAANARDSWDRWNDERDRYFERSTGYRYAHSSVYGLEDLDSHGQWTYIPSYGWCWYPRVAVGWAPYSYGRWAWIDWYGWTWVSYDPWGWAPYHYGRWFYHRPYGWCWYPGGRHYRHHWRPALVAFFGWGSHRGFSVGVGFGYGRVGWVPLAPYEPYYPWFGHRYYRGYGNTTYIDNSVNIVNNTNITNIYRNARIDNAVNAIDASQFGRGQGNLVRIARNDLDRVGLVKGQLPVAPGRESLRVSNREVQVAHLPRNIEGGRFFSRTRPEPVMRVPFEEQRRSMEQLSRRTTGERTVRAAEPARGETPEGRVARSGAPESRGAWRRVGEPPQPATEDRASGWRRFGDPLSRRDEAPNRAGSEGGVRTRPEAGAAREADTGSWRRFGDPVNRREAVRGGDPSSGVVNRTSEPDTGSWRRFGEPPRNTEGGLIRRQDGGRAVGREPLERRNDSVIRREPERNRSEDRGAIFRNERPEPPQREMPRYERPERSEPVRVSPPIVRERSSAPRYEGPRGGSDGGGVRSMPRGGGESGRVSRGDGGGRGGRQR